MGDKYCHALPFELVFTEKLEEAAVVVWDGVITPKMERIFPAIEEELKKGKILILTGESQTLYKNHSNVRFFHSPEVATIELHGWTVLPEEMLAALETCYQKITNV